MKALLLQITVLEPLVLAQPMAGEENSVIGQPYIPGSALRGAAIRAYMNAKGLRQLDLLADSQAHRLFFDGGLSFLNAYPAHPEDKQRALPCPRSWRVDKDSAAGAETVDVLDYPYEQSESGSYKSQGGKFFWDGERPILYQPEMMVVVHNASQDRNRKKAGDSTVFRFEAIPPRTYFCGAAVSQHDADIDLLQQLFSASALVLGGSQTAGYGRVDLATRKVADWQEYQENDNHDDLYVTVTLLSDAVFRAADGQAGADFDRALADLVGLTKAPRHLFAAQKLGLAGGFNRKWGLPLPQEWVVLAGSTYAYKAADLNPDALRKAASAGIGERREEGFGRLAVNLAARDKFTAGPLMDRQASPRPTAQLSPASRALAARTAERILQAQLDRHLVQAINRIRLGSPPHNAQLSRLRAAAARALAEHRLEPISQHMERLKNVGKSQLERARVLDGGQGRPLWDWLKERLQQNDILEQLSLGSSLPAVAGQAASLSPQLKADYMARFLEGVFRKAAKEKQAKEAK